MAHSYESAYPQGVDVSPEIVQFFRSFYEISDTPGDHDRYIDQFTSDATFILASKKAVGHGEIRPTREGMWAKVASRKHTIHKIFPFGPGSEEAMLYGTVALTFKDGGDGEVDWAARAVLTRDTPDGKYRMKFYQVYLVGATRERTTLMVSENKR